MSRAFTTYTVAHILGVPPKWLDNLLNNHPIEGLVKQKQGVARRLSTQNVLQLYLAKSLIDRLGCSIDGAVAASAALIRNGTLEICPGLRCESTPEITAELLTALLVDAVQASPPRTRGRPPSRVDPGT